ncbi:MAG: hypothetical protein AUG49_01350 [Catenulispora sp. 13_1_20CM_3_70_7]|nr:MAG: hypothetical protein AUG49_01350 [Catenulispora sp. 13_1_20CM_3_70_7]
MTSAGWVLDDPLAAAVAAIPGAALTADAADLAQYVYPLRTAEGLWTAARVPACSTAIYVTLDGLNRCLYTGIVQRVHRGHPNPAALRHRMAEHYKHGQPKETADTWRSLWVIPVRPDVPRSRLETWESRIRLRTASPQTRVSRLLRPSA